MAGSTRLRYFAASTQGKHGSTRLIFYGSAFAALAAAPRTIRSFVSRAAGPLTKKEQRLYFTEFFRTVDILLLLIFHSRHSTFALKIIILRTQ